MDRIRKERGYNYEDLVELLPAKIPNYEEQVGLNSARSFYLLCSLVGSF